MATGAAIAADVRAIVGIGGPLIINNLSSIGVAVADTLMAARLGALHLAAVAVGSGVWIALFLLGLGTVMALGPVVAQHHGAGRDAAIGADGRQALWLALLVSVPVVLGMRCATPVLEWMAIDPAVVVLSQGYLDALSFGVPGAYCYHALKQLCEGIGRTVPIMVVMMVALPLNVLLNYLFMFGPGPLPGLGAVGCGLGNGVAFWLMFLMLALYTHRARALRRYTPWGAVEAPDARALARLVALGAPIGLSLFLQSGLFTTVALLMGKLGTVAVAAHQVVLNYCGLVFMVPLGFAMALTVRVGQAIGRGAPREARRVGLTGIVLCAAVALVSGLTTLFFGPAIVALYTDDPAVAEVALLLIEVAVWLQVGDGIQVAAAFALRGLKDTRVPLLLNALMYWGVGFGYAWGVGIAAGGGAGTIWQGLSLALWSAGVLLLARFAWATARLLPARATA